MSDKTISAEFPYESHYVTVHGSQMHYIEQGGGDPILLLHGNPTSSYLWRNIIPHLTEQGRCIAPDLIGMGKSDKPKLDYRFFDHVKYLDGFIEALGLTNITLVIQDWGSGLGFHYAARHPENVKAIAFFEAILGPQKWSDFPGPARILFPLFRTDGVGWVMISAMNMFVNQMIPQSTQRKLTKEELQHYRAPYPTIASRKPVRQWPREIPVNGKPADVHQAVVAYNQWLQETATPMLLFTATPGLILDADAARWCEQNMKNLKVVHLGEGLHFLQEDYPHEIGTAIAAWLAELEFPTRSNT